MIDVETERILNGVVVTKTINPAGSDWIPLTNKYHTKCINCGEEIDEGTKILWKKGTGVKHTECEAKLVESMPEKKLIITEKEWIDFQAYSYEVLQKKTTCQCCGKKLTKGDKWFNCDRRVCEEHFAT